MVWSQYHWEEEGFFFVTSFVEILATRNFTEQLDEPSGSGITGISNKSEVLWGKGGKTHEKKEGQQKGVIVYR